MVCTSGRGARRASGASWCGSGCRTCSPTTPLSAATRGCVYLLPIVHLMKLADSHLAMVSSIATVRFKIELQILTAQCTQRLLFCLHLPFFSLCASAVRGLSGTCAGDFDHVEKRSLGAPMDQHLSVKGGGARGAAGVDPHPMGHGRTVRPSSYYCIHSCRLVGSL